MANSTGVIGYGTLLKRGNGAGTEVFTAIAECHDLPGPTLDFNMVDFTHQESTDGFEEMKPGMKLATDLTFTITHLPAGSDWTGLKSDHDNKTLRNFQIVFPDDTTTTWAFSAYVKTMAPTAPIKDRMTASITLAGIRGYTVAA